MLSIKLCLVALAAAAWAAQGANLTPDQKAKLDEFNKKCTGSSGAKPEQIAKVRAGNFANDPQIQKYFGCMMRSVGVVNQAGQLQMDALRSRVPKDMKKDEAMRIFFACKDKKGSNPDETAYLLYKCFWEASPRRIGLDGQ